MVDEYTGLAATDEAGTPQTTVPTDAPAQPEQPITKADLTALRDELLKSIQSQTGKAENRIKKEVDAKLNEVAQTVKVLKDAGYQITDAEVSALNANALREAIATSRQDSDPQSRPPANPLLQDQIKETNAAALQLTKDYGYVLTDNDPETYEINDLVKKGCTPEEYLAKVEESLVSAVTRTGRPLPHKQTPGSSNARLPGPSGSAAGGDKLAQYKREMDAALERGASVGERMNIRQKYRDQGAPI